MKTIVLDDDPTGTQSASGVSVLLVSDADLLTAALTDADSVYVQTNSRALNESDAVALVRRIKADGEKAAARLGTNVRFVLRGDSTLRGHVFAETDEFLSGDAIMLFVPAFPDGGRTTLDGIHRVRVGGVDKPAHESEYADDPVFPFTSSVLTEYIAEKSDRSGIAVPLSVVRSGGLAEVLSTAPAGAVVTPDAVTDTDVDAIALAVNIAGASGRRVIVRSASPLAAELAGVTSHGLLATPLADTAGQVLLVCGSHTKGATAQLAPIEAAWGSPIVVSTDDALSDPLAAARSAADSAAGSLRKGRVAVLTSERVRSSQHGTLDHGEKVMTALTTAVETVLPLVSVVVAKGGITSAEVARTGIGATSARVLGQVLPGVSVWRMTDRADRELTYVVVPGNVGDVNTLSRILAALED